MLKLARKVSSDNSGFEKGLSKIRFRNKWRFSLNGRVKTINFLPIKAQTKSTQRIKTESILTKNVEWWTANVHGKTENELVTGSWAAKSSQNLPRKSTNSNVIKSIFLYSVHITFVLKTNSDNKSIHSEVELFFQNKVWEFILHLYGEF